MTKVYHILIFAGFLLIPIFVFFVRLFYPDLSLFMIPDFGLSDVLHLNIPLKSILSQSLKEHEWPLWTPLLGGGMPALAEGQIGTFYLPNLLFFRFFDTVVAYNANLVLVYILTYVGSFLFARAGRISRLTSHFTATVFTFCGFFAVHLNHFNLLQAASLLPLVFWATMRLTSRKWLRESILVAFFVSQQIFTGHFYIVFITIVGVVLIIPGRVFHRLLLSLLFACLLSAVQLVPTYELFLESARSTGLDFHSVTAYPFPPQHLLSFFSPYVFGNPQDASYPPFSATWGIFWENTGYVGIVPLFLALGSIALLGVKKAKKMWVLLVVSLLLVLGKYSPLYFVFSVFPFSLFRVPSKFLLLTSFALAVLAGFSLDRIGQMITKRFVFAGIAVLMFIVVFADEYRFAYTYPPRTPASWWMETPRTLSCLKDEKGKLMDLGSIDAWNQVFLNDGWQDMSAYRHLKNFLAPNYPAVFSYATAGIYTGGLLPRRQSAYKQLLEKELDRNINRETKSATVSGVAKNMLGISAARYITSSYDIREKTFEKMCDIASIEEGIPVITVYRYKDVRPRAYLTSQIAFIETLEDFYRGLATAPSQEKVFIEDHTLTSYETLDTPGNVRFTRDTGNEMELDVESGSRTILVLADTKYPGWNAFVDGLETPIFTANLTQRAIPIPEGHHVVRFVYKPLSFEIGKGVTMLTMIIASLTVFLGRVFPSRRDHKKKKQPRDLFGIFQR